MGRFSKMVRNEKTKISKIYERIERLVSLSVFFIPISLNHFEISKICDSVLSLMKILEINK